MCLNPEVKLSSNLIFDAGLRPTGLARECSSPVLGLRQGSACQASRLKLCRAGLAFYLNSSVACQGLAI